MRSVSVPVAGSRIFRRISTFGENARHDDFIIREICVTEGKSCRKFVSFIVEHDVGAVDPRIDDADLDPMPGERRSAGELPREGGIH